MFVYPEVLVLQEENSQQLSEKEKEIVNNHIYLNICKTNPIDMLNINMLFHMLDTRCRQS